MASANEEVLLPPVKGGTSQWPSSEKCWQTQSWSLKKLNSREAEIGLFRNSYISKVILALILSVLVKVFI